MEAATELNAATLTALIGLVHKHTGIAMTERKSVLLQGRLQPRLRALGLASYAAYLKRLEDDHSEVQLFINMVTTNDTVFFRTPHVWDYFLHGYLPTWSAAHPGQILNIWSAAAASGEEAYSIAMLCEEYLHHAPGFRYQILATDISTEVLACGRAGIYGGRSVDRLQASRPQMLTKYFMSHAQGIEVRPILRKNVRFAEHNLLAPLHPPEKFDLVFLRNVLIYFEEDNQERVVRQASLSMKEDARLVLGESESLGRFDSGYLYEMPLIYSLAKVPA